MARPEVNIRITGETAGLSRAVISAQGSLKRLSADLSGIQALAARALNFAGIGGGLGIAWLVGLAKSVADTADEFGKMAQRTGDTTESLSRLAYAASLNDASLDDLRTGLVRLSTLMRQGSPLFDELGVKVTDASGKLRTSGDVFRDVASRFADLPDGAYKAGLATELFGRSVGDKLIPLLNQGAEGLAELANESDRFGKTITGEQAAAGARFNDNLVRLKALSQGVATEIGNSLIPALNSLAEEFLNANRAGLTFTQALLGIGLSNPNKSAQEQIDKLDKAIERLRTNLAKPGADQRQVKDLERYEKLRAYWVMQVEAEKRTKEEVSEIFQLQKQLTAEVGKLATLRKQQSTEQAKEELAGAEALKNALRAAWQESINGARAARTEAEAYFNRAAQAMPRAQERSADRRMRGLSDEDREIESRVQLRELEAKSRSLADQAIIARYEGRFAEAQRLAEQAEGAVLRADRLIDNLSSNREADEFEFGFGRIREEALKAAGEARQAEALQLEELAAAQQATLEGVEAKIAEIKRQMAEPVTLDLQITEAESRINELLRQIQELKGPHTVQVNVQRTDGGGSANGGFSTNGWTPEGFSAGGYTGPGGKYQPAGIVHAGEFVIPQHIVRQPGVLSMLSRMLHTGRFDFPGYSSGGLVSRLNPARISTPPRNTDERSVNVTFQVADLVKFDARVTESVLGEIHKASLKRGRRRP